MRKLTKEQRNSIRKYLGEFIQSDRHMRDALDDLDEADRELGDLLKLYEGQEELRAKLAEAEARPHITYTLTQDKFRELEALRAVERAARGLEYDEYSTTLETRERLEAALAAVDAVRKAP